MNSARGVGERRVIGVPLRIGMAVRAHDRQLRDRGVERARKIAGGGIGREQPVRMQGERQCGHDSVLRARLRDVHRERPADAVA